MFGCAVMIPPTLLNHKSCLATTNCRDTKQIKTQMVQQEKDRVAGIRRRGEDQLWLSRLNLRKVGSFLVTMAMVIRRGL